jgi:GTP-binding protein Era
VLTKLDRLRDPDFVLPVLATWAQRHEFAALIPTSAVTRHGLEALEREVVIRLPEAPRYYGEDDLTDRNLRWHVAELVRGELFEHLSEELPYSCAVVVTGYRERPEQDFVSATIFVERDSQKGMVIGKGGAVLKTAGTKARLELEALLGMRVHLETHVKVDPDWQRRAGSLDRLGL